MMLARSGALRLALSITLVCVLAFAFASCGKKQTRARQVRPVVDSEFPAPLRGTVGSEASIIGIDPVIVSGYGLVVGLNGTGGQTLPDRIAASMERQMGLQGVGKDNIGGNSAIANMTPRQLLRDPNVAVVVVQAAIPPGAPEGFTFDVFVRALNASSIEGGRLWSTDLQIGPPTVAGGIQTRAIAEARGEIFINPFAEPGGEGDGVTRTVGRVLSGGVVNDPLELAIVLDNRSHARSRAIASAINTRFPEGAGDRGATARGRDDVTVALSIPSSYRDDPATFIKTVEHVTIDPSFPEERARRYADAMKREPGLSDDLSWCLQALGRVSIPFARDLYEYPEVAPRVGGLEAGARLGDPQAAVPLLAMAEEGPLALRSQAVELLSDVPGGPTVDIGLRDLLADPTLEVRVAAYESLAARAERVHLNRLIQMEQSRSFTAGGPRPLPLLEQMARMNLPGDLIQGVQRTLIPGKFYLDQAMVGDPLIYITQQDEPRVVLFGRPELNRPLMVSIWSDRLMLISDTPTDSVRLFYRDPASGRTVIEEDVGTSIFELVKFMSHTPTPENPRPGLAMTYSEVVGALYGIYNQNGTNAAFATERDRLFAALLEASEQEIVEDRPETDHDEEQSGFDRPERELLKFDRPTTPPTPTKPRIVPLGGAPSGG